MECARREGNERAEYHVASTGKEQIETKVQTARGDWKIVITALVYEKTIQTSDNTREGAVLESRGTRFHALHLLPRKRGGE